MARPSSAKKPKQGSTSGANGGGSILNFFTRTPSDREREAGGEPATPTGQSKKPAAETSASAGRRSSVDGTRTSSFGSRKGKERAVDLVGSIEDPVVISDDDEPVSRPHLAAGPTSTSSVSLRHTGSEAGPSRPRRASPSPSEMPPPFAGMPDFKPPSTWPQIVNTATVDDDDDATMEEKDDDVDADHSYAQLQRKPPEDSQATDDDDSVAARSDGSHDDDDDEQRTPVDDEADEIQIIDPVDAIQPGLAGLDMEWGDDQEEGMGMEDFGEEEGLDLAEPPDRVLGKRKDKGRLPAKKAPEKLDKCPVCEISLKGKVKTIAEKHVNACLDKAGSKAAPGRKHQPISSFALASPAPSSRSPSPDVEEQSKGPNAFSVLMSGHKEREQWKDAEIDLKRDGKRTFGRRKAPFYKVMTGMPVAVDAFRYGAIPKVTAYLLSHAHSDHYTNLSKSWTHGPIYCSKTTANLIVHMLGVEPQWVHGLPDNEPFEMPNTGGVTVTPLEANHCPGSSIFLFEGRQTVNAGDSGFKSPYVGSKRIFRYLHCGDFRACPKMVLHPCIARARIDTCYLDTTYLNPKYCFPPQPQVIEACAQLARKTVVGLPEDAPPLVDSKPPTFDIKPEVGEDGEEIKAKVEPGVLDQQAEERGKAMMKGWLVTAKEESMEDVYDDKANVKREVGEEIKEKKKGRTLIVMGTYSIGKERIVKAVAKALGTTIYCDPRKRGILLCETDPDLHALLSTDPIASQVHLLPLGNIQLDRMQEYLVRLHPHFDRVLGFRPTGWSYSPPAGTDMMPDVNAVIRRDQARWFTDASLKPMRGSCRQFMMYGVPYSEHSSFFELTCFALSMPGPDLKMIATVNVGNEKSRAKMKKWFEKWLAEKARRKDKGLPQVVDYRDVSYW